MMTNLEMTVEALKLCVHPDNFARAMEQVRKRSADADRPVPLESMRSEQDRVVSVIRKLLIEVGVPTAIKGYRCMTTAIQLLLEQPDYADSFTKGLYPAVGEVHNATGSRVERAIRHGIEVAWSRGDHDLLYRYFGNSVSGEKGKPTNSEFLTLLADVVREKLAE